LYRRVVKKTLQACRRLWAARRFAEIFALLARGMFREPFAGLGPALLCAEIPDLPFKSTQSMT
jgi:hypothetical protein